MPHLTLEYSSNLDSLDIPKCLREFNQVLVDSGEFTEIDIKSRAIRFDRFLVGLESGSRAFAHVKLSILSGRDAATKQKLSGALLERLTELCRATPGSHVQLCVEIVDIDRASYAKSSQAY